MAAVITHDDTVLFVGGEKYVIPMLRTMCPFSITSKNRLYPYGMHIGQYHPLNNQTTEVFTKHRIREILSNLRSVRLKTINACNLKCEQISESDIKISGTIGIIYLTQMFKIFQCGGYSDRKSGTVILKGVKRSLEEIESYVEKSIEIFNQKFDIEQCGDTDTMIAAKEDEFTNCICEIKWVDVNMSDKVNTSYLRNSSLKNAILQLIESNPFEQPILHILGHTMHMLAPFSTEREEYISRPMREEYIPRPMREEYIPRPTREEYIPRPMIVPSTRPFQDRIQPYHHHPSSSVEYQRQSDRISPLYRHPPQISHDPIFTNGHNHAAYRGPRPSHNQSEYRQRHKRQQPSTVQKKPPTPLEKTPTVKPESPKKEDTAIHRELSSEEIYIPDVDILDFNESDCFSDDDDKDNDDCHRKRTKRCK